MKKLVLSLASVLLVLASTVSYAQITEGTIEYKIEMDTDDAQMQQAIAMMSNSTMTMMFMGTAFRQDMDMGMQKTTTIFNGKEGKKAKGIMLMDVMGMKMAIDITPDEEEKKEDPSENQKVKVTDETKDILGFKCKKVIITDEEDNEMILYVTDKIKPAGQSANKYGGGLVDGFPLMIEVDQAMMTMVMTATKVDEQTPKKSLFDTKIPEGYTVKTMDELQMMGGGE